MFSLWILIVYLKYLSHFAVLFNILNFYFNHLHICTLIFLEFAFFVGLEELNLAILLMCAYEIFFQFLFHLHYWRNFFRAVAVIFFCICAHSIVFWISLFAQNCQPSILYRFCENNLFFSGCFLRFLSLSLSFFIAVFPWCVWVLTYVSYSLLLDVSLLILENSWQLSLWVISSDLFLLFSSHGNAIIPMLDCFVMF